MFKYVTADRLNILKVVSNLYIFWFLRVFWLLTYSFLMYLELL